MFIHLYVRIVIVQKSSQLSAASVLHQRVSNLTYVHLLLISWHMCDILFCSTLSLFVWYKIC